MPRKHCDMASWSSAPDEAAYKARFEGHLPQQSSPMQEGGVALGKLLGKFNWMIGDFLQQRQWYNTNSQDAANEDQLRACAWRGDGLSGDSHSDSGDIEHPNITSKDDLRSFLDFLLRNFAESNYGNHLSDRLFLRFWVVISTVVAVSQIEGGFDSSARGFELMCKTGQHVQTIIDTIAPPEPRHGWMDSLFGKGGEGGEINDAPPPSGTPVTKRIKRFVKSLSSSSSPSFRNEKEDEIEAVLQIDLLRIVTQYRAVRREQGFLVSLTQSSSRADLLALLTKLAGVEEPPNEDVKAGILKLVIDYLKEERMHSSNPGSLEGLAIAELERVDRRPDINMGPERETDDGHKSASVNDKDVQSAHIYLDTRSHYGGENFQNGGENFQRYLELYKGSGMSNTF